MDAIQRFPRSWWFPAALAVVLGLVAARGALATDYGAITTSSSNIGTWNLPVWISSGGYGSPGSGDNAYIGSTYPTNSWLTASITLAGSQSVNNLYLGYGNVVSSGTLYLDGYKLAVGSGLYFGQSGGSGTIIENGGSFSTPNLTLSSSNSLVLGVGDTVSSSVSLNNGSHLTTTTSASVTGAVSLSTGSTLTMGAPLTLSGNNTLDVEQLATLDMGGYPLSASSVYFGWFSSLGISVLNRGPIPAPTSKSTIIGAGGSTSVRRIR